MIELGRTAGLAPVLARLKPLASDGRPSRSLLEDLVEAWGNEPFAADVDLLDEMTRLSQVTTGPILECGCGLSSVVLAATAGLRGVEIWSLEYMAEWIDEVAFIVEQASLPGVHLCHCPMRAYGDFAWYDPPLASLPQRFPLVVCDGPNGLHPLARPRKDAQARYGLMPILGHRLPTGGLILLDDVHRAGERDVLRRWLARGDFDCRVESSAKGAYAVLRRRPLGAPAGDGGRAGPVGSRTAG